MNIEDRRTIWNVLDRVLTYLVIPALTLLFVQERRITILENKTEDMPPNWMREDLHEIKSTVKEIEARLREVEKKVSK